MDTFYKKFSFIMTFIIFILFFHMIFGQKITTYFLALVLGGSVVFNADKIIGMFDKINGGITK